ncbi:serpin family protein [Acutalibacter caecimuris]|uniref:serpin family protein n=1 Tax=Acutalibacter caecimuris TaxID=3093657 RepID=UPI002AC90B85|nr:serpin family protein [Acutalibacter sp. M00118]
MRATILKKLFLSTLCLALTGALALGGCGGPISGGKPPKLSETDPNCPTALTTFGLDLLKHALQKQPAENALLSPLSITNALAMTANGAQGDTLAQMETAFGTEIAPLREFLSAYNAALPVGDKYRLHQANSLWVKEEEVALEPGFLQLNTGYFGANLFEKPFDDTTLEEINSWVSKHTSEMIPQMLDKLPKDTVLMLVNALAFEAEWEQVYNEYDVLERLFTHADGTETSVPMMASTEKVYLQDGQAQGFIKFYADRQYAFAALLPDEGVSLSDYLAGLSGQHLHQLLTGGQDQPVLVEIPKFQADYNISLAQTLQDMGIRDAFDAERADFSGMGHGAQGEPLFISHVLHKTHISVYEQGTKAGAATVVAMAEGAALVDDLPAVRLNRPFLYMILDAETRLPVFLGAMYAPQQAE